MPGHIRLVLKSAFFFFIMAAAAVVAGCGGGGGGGGAVPLPENVTIQVFCGRGVEGTTAGVYSQKRNTAFAYDFSLSAGYKDIQVYVAGNPAPSSGSPVIAADVMIVATAVPTGDLPRFKTNTHTHTTGSVDGYLTPAEIVTAYRDLGYDVLFITDHNKITPADAPAGMLLIPGEELTTASKHANALFAAGVIDPVGKPAAVFIQEAIDSGAIVMLNHPVWTIGWSLPDILPLTGVSLIEIYNASCELKNFHDTQALWDNLLSSGRLWYGVASDDAHRDYEIGHGWIMVQADALDSAKIRQGMEQGSFYASTGIELARLDYTGGVVYIESRNGETVDFIGKNGGLLLHTSGPFGQYQVQAADTYVRAVVTGKNGIKAWTQPLFWTAAP